LLPIEWIELLHSLIHGKILLAQEIFIPLWSITIKRPITINAPTIPNSSVIIEKIKSVLGTGFQIIQSLYAIGPGGLLGRGFGNSIQKHFYLPEPQTDFIFSIITEEFGIVGPILIIVINKLLPPYERKGRVTPVTGIIPDTTIKFNIA